MKLIRIPDNSVIGPQEIIISEARYRQALRDIIWCGDGCTVFNIHIDGETKIATINTRCSMGSVEVEILPAPGNYQEAPTRIPELVDLLY